MTLRATVLVPTHNHGPTLLYSVPTALAQSVSDIEVIIVGDGVGDAARDIISQLQRGDPRVNFLDFPKGRRRGEDHRHTALSAARGRIVCYLADDDLWLPNHLAVMDALLHGDVGFAHTLPLRITKAGGLADWPVDLAIPHYRELTLANTNWIPLSTAGHTLDAYRRLPIGWSAAPRRVSDTAGFMWQKLIRSGCGLVSESQPTVLVFPSVERVGWVVARRVEEMALWQRKTAEPGWRETFLAEALDYVVRDRARAASVTPRANMYRLLARLKLLNPIRRARTAAKGVFARPRR